MAFSPPHTSPLNVPQIVSSYPLLFLPTEILLYSHAMSLRNFSQLHATSENFPHLLVEIALLLIICMLTADCVFYTEFNYRPGIRMGKYREFFS